ncbi:hypothetical protein EV678_0298 [Azospira oryzae]|uniref:Transposase DDE domain-containing protein n=1 Tax=Azospira oryzae TaxID=146939 RepID=A0ABY0IQX7_9RHOO|nr:hypothetical protein EV678_0298 [Azospira oryzae]
MDWSHIGYYHGTLALVQITLRQILLKGFKLLQFRTSLPSLRLRLPRQQPKRVLGPSHSNRLKVLFIRPLPSFAHRLP